MLEQLGPELLCLFFDTICSCNQGVSNKVKVLEIVFISNQHIMWFFKCDRDLPIANRGSDLSELKTEALKDNNVKSLFDTGQSIRASSSTRNLTA